MCERPGLVQLERIGRRRSDMTSALRAQIPLRRLPVQLWHMNL
jgi:hypothetical protein